MHAPIGKRRRLTRAFAATATVALLGVTGCNGDDGDAGGGDPGATVTITDFAFAPTTLTVPAGTEVLFSNQDTVGHTATADDGSFDEQLNTGVGQTVTFDTPGTFPYHCAIHPQMTAEIIVE